jgi:siroheme decarboxylase
MSELSVTLLDRIQSGFPLTPTPYADLAAEFHTTETEIISSIQALKESGVIRRIGASIDARKAGYISTLVACKVDPKQIEDVAKVINNNPGVTHSYERSSEYNLWFTIIARNDALIAEFIERYRNLPGVSDIHSLPASKVYKIKMQLGSADD